MAGIGFTLKRVISRGDVTSFALGSLGGVFIVAGPSILSMVSLWLVTGPLASAQPGSMGPFTAALIYTLMGSTILSAGLQYTFTRSVADSLHRGQEGQAVGALLKLLAWLAPLSFALGALVAWLLVMFPGSTAMLESITVGILASSTTCLWILVLFSSMLHRYLRVLVLYAFGMAAAVLLSGPLAKAMGSAGLALAFAGAYLVIDIGLLVFILAERKPLTPVGFDPPRKMAQRYPALLLYGFAYQGALWADKIITWFSRGRQEPGSSLFLAPQVDSVAYLASLSLVPGLVFFIVSSETEYFAALRRFLNALAKQPYRVIRSTMHELQVRAKSAVARLATF
ncbi:MAG TPA: exopolysaccharide Pel transporter PelG, partial [Spirochaetales bacterium]|nr:exopolysaccharide Pel transporter PelG [Spirochaetales bacterium]